jgi:hypothetical protein
MWTGTYTALELTRAIALTTTSATPSRTVDLAAYASLKNREVLAVVQVGALSTTATLTLNVEVCATTNGTWAAPSAGTTTATVTAAGITEIPFYPNLRYVRLAYTLDATGSVPTAASLLVLDR